MHDIKAATDSLRPTTGPQRDEQTTSITTDPSAKMSAVCFTAILETGGYLGPSKGDTNVVFNKQITNVRNAYDISTGYFTAPKDGNYYFSFSYQADKSQPSGLTLKKNGEEILRTFDNNTGFDYVDNGSNSACLVLNQGDRVNVVLPANCHVQGFGNCTSFTGFLMA